jgi:hypothetical protein
MPALSRSLDPARWSASESECKRPKWSVGVPAAHLRGKEEDRVRFPDGPLDGPACRWRRLTLARSVWWVRLPSGPLWLDDEKRLENAGGVSAAPCAPPIGGWATRKADSKRRMSGRCGIVRDLTLKRTTEGSWSNGKTPVRQTGNPGSIPGGSTETKWKVAGYGLPGRFAKPCDLRVMWVQIPCLPLTTADHASHGARAVPSPMVKRTSSLASNEVFRVRVLVGLLMRMEGQPDG